MPIKDDFSFSFQIHFRRDHFLCEDESCLAKKFVVFQSESELKVGLVGLVQIMMAAVKHSFMQI